MSNEELVDLIQKGINPGDNMERLYYQNKGFIFNVIKRYRYAYQNDHLGTPIIEVEDLMQEAYFGLYEAANKYEDTAGVLFISYASFWIHQAIKRYLEINDSTIRLPGWLHRDIYQLRKAEKAFIAKYDRMPTEYELCCMLHISEKKLMEIRDAISKSKHMDSLDRQIDDTDGIVLGDSVAGGSNIEDDVVNNIMERSLQTELWQIVRDNTTEIQYEVLRERYKGNLTLAKIGEKHNLTRERARQIESKALNKLRQYKIRKILEEKFEINYARAYRGSLSFFNNTWSSIVEDIAIKNMAACQSELP